MAQTELLFALLTTGECCEANDWIKALKRLHPERIDWSSRNDDGLTILVQCVIVLLRNSSCEQEMLNMIEHFISYGASITQKCTAEASATFVFYKDSDGDELLVKPSGLSAISYVQAWAREFDVDTRFSDESKRLAKALNCFAGAETQHVRVPVYEGIIELWEKFLTAESAHDLTIEAADGLVTAHAQMLKEASAVVTAMLASPMKEGQLQRIQVKDVAKREVSLFLEILYTCSTHNEPDYKTALQALDLAHRWQVDVVVMVLANLLQGPAEDDRAWVVSPNRGRHEFIIAYKVIRHYGIMYWCFKK
ncbi:unnamed protein product [Durusdinium trenchii]|uniref:BTB domain-containing protein n=1 Tax=Durusdinium trenchii TaxID=1381693 RepID=A0ABP0L0B6_9DINO